MQFLVPLLSTLVLATHTLGYEARALAPDQAAEDVRIFRASIERLHAGYGRYTSAEAMDAMFDDLEREAADGMTDMELYRRTSLILSRMRCDHTKAELPQAIIDYRNETPTYLPFTFKLFAGRMHVANAAEGSPLERGDEIVSINGKPTGRVLADVQRYVSVDGFTDSTARVEMEYSSEYLGDAVDHFWPFLYGWPTEWTLEVRTTAGDMETHTLAPITYGEYRVLATGGRRSFNFPETVTFDVIDGETASLSIGTFVNYRQPVAPATVFDPIFDQIAKNDIDHLILDLRNCGGGSDDVPATLTAYLTDSPVPVGKRPPWVRAKRLGDLEPFVRTWDKAAMNLPEEFFRDVGNGYFEVNVPGQAAAPVEAKTNRFDGRLTVLSSAANASGATILIALLQERYGATVVGQPTGGSAEGPTAGIMLFVDLPHSDVTVRVPVIRSWVNVDHPEPGMGVTPDIVVEPTFDDWLAGTDTVLNAAIALHDK
ncbi:MAG: S41 family peptidase [Planctomycetota bacterium]